MRWIPLLLSERESSRAAIKHGWVEGGLGGSVVVMSSWVCLQSWRLMPAVFKPGKIRSATRAGCNRQPPSRVSRGGLERSRTDWYLWALLSPASGMLGAASDSLRWFVLLSWPSGATPGPLAPTHPGSSSGCWSEPGSFREIS